MIPGPHRMKGGAPLLGARPGQVGPFGPYGAEMRDAADVEIELLTVPACPNRQLAAERLRQALGEAGLNTTLFTTRAIADQAEAEQTGFTGSPTILIDGRDPFAEPDAAPSLSCRIYRTPDGPAGAPGLDQLRQALRTAAGTDTGL
ncbi:thioredoxin family protein [Nonomuraea jabiensis]|uniref:thioredoxin family protein n=1 Tax=Nonomuraea jabiensis TaxID=882448 RepID=UPI003D734032